MHIFRRFIHVTAQVNKSMKLVQFKTKKDDKVKIGVLKNEKIIDVNFSDKSIPNSLVEFLNQENALDRIKSIAASPQLEHLQSDVKLLSPITKPDKIIGVMLNYKGDCDKRNIPYSKEPSVFTKFASVIAGPYDDIAKASNCQSFDWEVELVVVIGKKARHVSAGEALDYVLGYTATEDLTAKDWIKPNGQLLLCKNMEGFCPLGPCLVTADEFGDPHNIRVRSWVNGELKQDANTNEMIHRIDKIIEYLTSAMTLLPGDIICTGTPFGYGSTLNPPQFLQKGDVLETEIEKIGRMINRIV